MISSDQLRKIIEETLQEIGHGFDEADEIACSIVSRVNDQPENPDEDGGHYPWYSEE